MRFSSTQQSIAWFRDQYVEGSLILKPDYQRKPVWVARQKCWLVESVLKQIPIPELFIQRTTDENGRSEYAVVDGQQRVRTLLQFVGSDRDEDQVEFDRFVLDKLPQASPWYGLAFAELTDQDKRGFYNYALAVRNLETQDEEEVKDMFRRINRFTTVLNSQEIRNATYGGPFAELATKQADEYGDFLAENLIISAAQIRRMNDVEFTAELIIAVLHGPQGGTPKTIDDYYQQYEDIEGELPEERRVKRTLRAVISMIEEVVPNLRSSRWHNKSDFYTLFAALAGMVESGEASRLVPDSLKSTLTAFAAEVDHALAVETAQVSEEARSYLRAVLRGANDKARRAARHLALTTYITQRTAQIPATT